jgi:predicted Zn finger-like uncharacterized protein
MSLVTRCPACGTAFRVQPAQLAARGGIVRCGKCGDVFDGVASLVEEGGERLLLEPSPQLGLFDPSRRPPQGAQPAQPARPALDEAPLPEFMAELQPRAARRWPWTIAVLAAAALLAAQATFRYRSELAVSLPAARGPLDTACRWLRCEVPLPRRIKLLSIDSYEVRADPKREGVIVLNAVIRNRAPFPQDYPALQLTLTDEATRHVVSRVLSPREYLDAERAAQLIARGIDAGGETSLTVYFDASRTRATGYQLVLFYPT